jgi:hypothetical protein
LKPDNNGAFLMLDEIKEELAALNTKYDHIREYL